MAFYDQDVEFHRALLGRLCRILRTHEASYCRLPCWLRLCFPNFPQVFGLWYQADRWKTSGVDFFGARTCLLHKVPSQLCSVALPWAPWTYAKWAEDEIFLGPRSLRCTAITALVVLALGLRRSSGRRVMRHLQGVFYRGRRGDEQSIWRRALLLVRGREP